MPCNRVKITHCLYALTPFLAWFGFFFIKVVFSARIKRTLLNIQFLLIPELQNKISTVINLKIVFAIYFNVFPQWGAEILNWVTEQSCEYLQENVGNYLWLASLENIQKE